MKIVERGVIYDAGQAPANRRFCSHTNALIMQDGRILVTFRAGSMCKDSPDENIIIRNSADGGKTWETLVDGFAALENGVPSGWRKAALTEMAPGHLIGAFNWFDRSDPTRRIMHPETGGTLPSRIIIMESSDGGRTWGDSRTVETSPYTGISACCPMLKLRDSALALPYESWKSYFDASPGRHHAILRVSHDSAHTFGPSIIVANDPANQFLYWDQRMAVDPESGTIIDTFWTYDRIAKRDTHPHIAWGSPDGATWSRPADMGFAGQKVYPLPLPGGRLLAVYEHRHTPPSMRIVMSKDLGKTWDMAHELVFFEAGVEREAGMETEREFKQAVDDMFEWTFGHPIPLWLSDGQVFIAFYAGDAESQGIHWVRIAP
jgi:hypothetical protein